MRRSQWQQHEENRVNNQAYIIEIASPDYYLFEDKDLNKYKPEKAKDIGKNNVTHGCPPLEFFLYPPSSNYLQRKHILSY